MKKFFFTLFVVVIIVPLVSAQDIITLKNGDDIQAVVQEIGDVEIKYKKFENLNGPNYTLKKSDVFMIRYENGSKDVFSDVFVQTQPSVQSNVQSPSGQTTNYESFVRLRKNEKEMAAFLKPKLRIRKKSLNLHSEF